MLVQHVVELIEGHEPTTPLFLFWAPHVIHTPLQVPPAFFNKFDFIAPTDKVTHERQIYHAMVYFADEMVGNVTGALRQKGMWESTLMVMSTGSAMASILLYRLDPLSSHSPRFRFGRDRFPMLPVPLLSVVATNSGTACCDAMAPWP